MLKDINFTVGTELQGIAAGSENVKQSRFY